MDTTLAVIAVTVVGLMVGVELSVAFVINPITLRLPDAALIEARADGARMLGRTMPFWYIASMILSGAFAATIWGTTSAVCAIIATGLLAVSVAMSVLLLVPINNRSAAWTAEVHPDDWREQQQRWDRLHYARLAIIVAAFVFVAAAAAL